MPKLNTKQTKWNLNSLCKLGSDEEMEKEKKLLTKISYKFINKWKLRKDYLSDPVILKQALDEFEEWSRCFGSGGKFGYYIYLRCSQNQSDPDLKAKSNKYNDFELRIINDIQFFEMNIAKISKENQELFLNSPILKEYRHYLEQCFKIAKYLLNENEEKILNLLSRTSRINWTRMTSDFLSKEMRSVLQEDGTKQKRFFTELFGNLRSNNKAVRDAAGKAINSVLSKLVDVAEYELNSILDHTKVIHELKCVERPDLPRHLADDIDSKVVDTLRKAVTDRFDISQEYYKLKSKIYGVDKLAYHERFIEKETIDTKYSYDDSVTLIYDVLFNLDKEFADIFKTYVEDGRIDVYPNKGKSGGAFCVGDLILPTYILLNHNNRLADVAAIAHEVGHGINNELMKKTRNSLDFGTPLCIAEVASTFMEDFVFTKLMNKADENTKLCLIMNKLSDDVSSIFRQIACYNFELELHNDFRNKGYLSKVSIGDLFQKHMSRYMGSSIEQSAGSQNWWVYWSHIRNSFYVYSYASGLLISKSLQNSVQADSSFILKIKEFLEAGESDSPKNIFKKLDIDIEDSKFWHKGLNQVEQLLKIANDLAYKLGKI